ncbi:hypothetical protein, partial [Mesorhizobium sp. M1D.F.Ca.ET.234.01.1.1]|uniref:hypothetical protein n=1 Tax=Mesorhizobium sp. M1D.F.Ca.ET.234.01.1.1 TaxID=2563932 RepID=UPI001AEE8C46
CREARSEADAGAAELNGTRAKKQKRPEFPASFLAVASRLRRCIPTTLKAATCLLLDPVRY